MAREIKFIQLEIENDIAGNSELVQLNSTSKVAVFRLFSFVIATAIWLLEKIFDTHKLEIDNAIYNQKSGTGKWYQNKSLDFQYGFDLIEDTDKFDNVNFTSDEIEASKIVKYCSVRETQESNKLFIKIASESAGTLQQITNEQLIAFTAYINEIKYAGVRVSVVNNPADILNLQMVVYRDPLVIDSAGNNIVSGGRTIEVAIVDYLQNLPFDGQLVVNDFIAYLRKQIGVINVNVVSIASSSFDAATLSFSTETEINVSRVPSAGYFTITNFNQITYVV